MSTFVALKSAGMGNRFKIYVSYMARYENVKIEKPTDIHLVENFDLCSKEEDIKIYPHTSSGWRLLVDDDEVKYIDKYIDRETQFQKSFLEPLNSIADVIAWSTEHKSTLEDFFA